MKRVASGRAVVVAVVVAGGGARWVGACVGGGEARDAIVAETDTGTDTDCRIGGTCDSCRIDLDCPSPDACSTGRCDRGACVVEAVTCDDGNDCTDDTCDPASGCAHAPSRPGAYCAVGGGSNACDGDTYHNQDQCDGEGHCTETGTIDCAQEGGGACWRSACVITDAGGGCEIVPRNDGLACNADGLSDECSDGRLHGADRCLAGECVEAGSTLCPSGFCETPVCGVDGGCATRTLGVERALPGNWQLFEMYQGADGIATVQAGFAFDGEGRVETYGALTSVPEVAPGDGDYCISVDGDLRFALPYGAVAPAPTTLYRGVLAPGGDIAVVFREGAPSLGVLVSLPSGSAPTLTGDYRVVGLLRRNVIGVRALLGVISFDAEGCVIGGGVRSSDEFETLAVPAGGCMTTLGWLVGLELGLDAERYVLRGTTLHDGDLAVLTRHTDTTSVGDALILLVRQRDLGPFDLAGRDAWARLDLGPGGRIGAGRGAAEVNSGGDYLSYEEQTLDGQRFALGLSTSGDAGVYRGGGFVGAYVETSPGDGGGQRHRTGQFGAMTGTGVGLLVDVAIDRPGLIDEGTSPSGISLRIGVRRP